MQRDSKQQAVFFGYLYQLQMILDLIGTVYPNIPLSSANL